MTTRIGEIVFGDATGNQAQSSTLNERERLIAMDSDSSVFLLIFHHSTVTTCIQQRSRSLTR